MLPSTPTLKPPQTPPAAPPALLWHALIPVIGMMALIYFSVVRFETTAHIALILSTALAAAVGICIGRPWRTIESGLIDGIAIGLKAILILLVIGLLIATWIMSGIVPYMIYAGLQLLSPSVFLPAACLICCVVSVSTGSSWTTAGTVGVALIGMGGGLGLPLPLVAGAIISGSYFGDKLSPLSDTTNLAPAAAGSELFEHIQYMLYTTVPALLIALLLYTVLGRHAAGEPSGEPVMLIRSTLAGEFRMGPGLLLPLLLVIVMIVLKIPALPALLGGALLGGALAIVVQGKTLAEVLKVAYGGFVASTGHPSVDELLSRGGLTSMLETIALIICALAFGGVMERAGFLATLAAAILKFAHGTGRLVTATLLTCFGMNLLASDQYLSIVMPGRMYRDAFNKEGLQPKVLSRTLEDGGTLSSPLIPWNSCGAFMGTTLAVPALSYAPYAFVNLLCPILAILFACTGWKIARQNPGPPAR
jgi:Na+:H+ antiporter, NhaC family